MNILLLGKPGAGKGTLAYEILKNNKNINSLSTGNLLREAAKNDKALSKKLSKGCFATDEQINDLVMNFLEERKGGSVLFDGYPRTIKQLENCMSNFINFDLIINLEVKDEAQLKERIVNRLCHASSGRIYNTKTKPPKVSGCDDLTLEELIKREDDNEKSFKTRMSIFEETTKPLIEKLRSHENFIEINATDSILNIYNLIEFELQKLEKGKSLKKNQRGCKI